MEVICEWMLGVKGALAQQAAAVLELQTQHTETKQWMEEPVQKVVQACSENVEQCKEQIHQYKKANAQWERWWTERGATEHAAYEERRAMQEEDEGDIEEEGGRDERKEEASLSAAPGPVPGKGPTDAPEVKITGSKVGAAPKVKEMIGHKATTETSRTTEHETDPVKFKAGRSDDPPTGGAHEEDEVEESGPRVPLHRDGGGRGDDDDDDDDHRADDDLPTMEEGCSDKDAHPAGKKANKHFYSNGDDEDEKAREDENRLTRARVKHILPKKMRTRNEGYKNHNKKGTDASEQLIELLNKFAGSTNNAEAALAAGIGIPMIPTWNAAGWTSWKPKWLQFADTVYFWLVT